MPLTAQVSKSTFSFPSLELPYLSTDFDFETVKHFERGDKPETKEANKLEKEGARPRLGSGETIQTIETQTIAESKADLNASKINYEKLKNVMGINLGDLAAGTGSYDMSAQ